MSGLKLTDVIKTVRWNDPPVSTNDESTATAAGGLLVADDTTSYSGSAFGRIERPTGLDRLKKAFLTDLPAFIEGKTIAQSIAESDGRAGIRRDESGSGSVLPRDEQNAWAGSKTDGGHARTRRSSDATPVPHEIPFHTYGACPSLSVSERVVRSHLRYLTEFEPFKKGVFSQSSLYEFLFYMIVEKGRRESYTKRVIKSVMAYLRAGGASAMGDLSAESKRYVDDFRGMGGIKFSTFYRRMDAVTSAIGDDRTKRLLSTARRKRALVFNDDEESRILRYCVRVIRASINKYVTFNERDGRSGRRVWHASDAYAVSDEERGGSSDKRIDIITDVAASDTRPTRIGYERTIFEFSFAYLLGFLSGARIKSTVLKLSLEDVENLLAGNRLEVLTKGVFANVFLPASVLANEPDIYGHVMSLRTRSLLYKEGVNRRVGEEPTTLTPDPDVFLDGSVDTDSGNEDNSSIGGGDNDRSESGRKNRFFTRSPRQLELMLDRVYKCLFENKTRTKGVRWHSQRRRYLGTINSRFGATTASESVGHRDLATTMAYINNSLHMDDVRSRADKAITERYDTIISRPATVKDR